MKVSCQTFLHSCHESYQCFVTSRKGEFIRALRNIHNGDFANMVSDLTAKETLGGSPTRNLTRSLVNPSLLEAVS